MTPRTLLLVTKLSFRDVLLLGSSPYHQPTVSAAFQPLFQQEMKLLKTNIPLAMITPAFHEQYSNLEGAEKRL